MHFTRYLDETEAFPICRWLVNWSIGLLFLENLISFVIYVCIVIYVLMHFCVPDTSTRPKLSQFVVNWSIARYSILFIISWESHQYCDMPLTRASSNRLYRDYKNYKIRGSYEIIKPQVWDPAWSFDPARAINHKYKCLKILAFVHTNTRIYWRSFGRRAASAIS